MDLVGLVLSLIVSIPLGIVGGWAYQRYRYWKIRRHAPSAKVVGYHVVISKSDWEHLPKREKDVVYYFAGKDGSPNGQAKE